MNHGNFHLGGPPLPGPHDWTILTQINWGHATLNWVATSQAPARATGRSLAIRTVEKKFSPHLQDFRVLLTIAERCLGTPIAFTSSREEDETSSRAFVSNRLFCCCHCC